ncbi:keratin-associated protein 5-2-like [Vidua macroura]|uniref:keratin-associated protein 5-2-like n=1 Tax=Vidua chalybeata TaxID=81927 RepID=UPI0023A7C07A|nr:keratin-associated protein 5-2-like [Vidua chalybeata]XP_053857329.1 keratin-associated protein 5-2-like [Vidua macroura]
MIYSSGRESFFNLNSTWYDPSGSWLDTRRTPFRYGYATCCSSGCHGEGVEGMRGHDYRHYGYRQPRCAERCHGYSSSTGSCHEGGGSCVRRPTYSYGGSGGCQGYGRSVCSERCQGSSGSCHGGGGSCVRRPTYSYGGSGGCQGYGRSVCSERCHGPAVAQGGKPCCGTAVQSIPVQSCPPPVQSIPVQSCPPQVQTCPCPPPVQSCPPPVQTCPCPCPPPVQQGCVPVAKGIPRQQQKQICKVPARKMK